MNMHTNKELCDSLAEQRRRLCAEHDKTLAELQRVRDVAHAEIERLRAALAPFANIAGLVEHTPRRDGERVFELPNPAGGYFTLVRDDFQRAASAYQQSEDRK